jgi:Family of unknown function (DUF6113)
VGHVLRVGLLAAAAVVVAVCGAFVHTATVRPAGVPVPYGLVLALLGVAALLVLAQLSARSRIGKGAVAAGWLVPVVLMSQPSRAGDVVIAGDIRGLVYLFGGVILIGVAVGLPNLRRSDNGADGRVG